MALGINRDYKSADRRARTQLAKHQEMMHRLLADFSEMTREDASRIALEIMEGKRSYPWYQQKA